MLFVWAAVLVAVGAGAAAAPSAEDNGTSFMPGIEAQKAFDLMKQRFPGTDGNAAGARIVFVAPHGEKVTAADNRRVIDAFVSQAGKGPQVASAASPFRAAAVNEDASMAYSTVTYKVKADDLTDAGKTALRHAIDEARRSGMTVVAGGTALATLDARDRAQLVVVAYRSGLVRAGPFFRP